MSKKTHHPPAPPPTSLWDQVLHLLFHVLFFFTPLVLWPGTSEVFEFNKMLFVYALTGLIIFTWIGSSINKGHLNIRRTPLDLPIFLFFLAQLLSTIVSINPHTSIWGYYSRFHGGLASTICYLLLFYAFVSNINLKSIPNILNSILGSAILISLYAVLERLGIDKHVWVQDVQNRVFSTLGQPNWLSAYLVAILPISIFQCYLAKSLSARLIHASSALLFFTSILFTKSQSGIGTTLVILLLIPLSLILHHRHHRGTGSSPVLVPLGIGLILIMIIFGTPWTPSPSDLQDRLNTGGPLWPQAEKYLSKINLTTQLKPTDTSNFTPKELEQHIALKQGIRYGGSSSMEIRRVVWSGAFELGSRYPLFGTGPETFGYTYYWVRPVSHNLNSEWEFLYNKAHNEYLNFLANSGYIGLISYLLLIVSIIAVFTRNLLHSNSHDHAALSTSLLLGFFSILVTNFFGFSVVTVAVFFFLYPAIIIAVTPSTHTLSLKLKYGWLLLGITAILTLIWLSTVYGFFASDIKYNQGKSALAVGDVNTALPLLQQAVSQNQNEPTFLAILAEAEAQAAAAVHQQLRSLDSTSSASLKKQGETMATTLTDLAVTHTNQAIKMNKYQTNFYKSKAKADLYLSTIDPAYRQTAINTLLELSAYTPTDPKVFYNIGLLYQNNNNLDAATQALQKALDLKPDYVAVQNALKVLEAK